MGTAVAAGRKAPSLMWLIQPGTTVDELGRRLCDYWPCAAIYVSRVTKLSLRSSHVTHRPAFEKRSSIRILLTDAIANWASYPQRGGKRAYLGVKA